MLIQLITCFASSSFHNLSFFVHSEGDDLRFVLSDVVGPSLVDEYEPTLCGWVFLVRAWRNFDGFSIQCNLSRFEDNVEIKFREFETPWSVKYLETHWWCGFAWIKWKCRKRLFPHFDSTNLSFYLGKCFLVTVVYAFP